jgi:hypothetical protein
MSKKTIRIGVMIAPLGSGDDHRALEYLLLYQNTLQKSFEFHLLTVPDDPLIDEFNPNQSPDSDEVEKKMPDFIKKFRKILAEDASDFGLDQDPVGPIIILSAATFSNNFYTIGGNDWGIIALGNWQSDMAPPSIVEFFLSIIIGMSVGFSCAESDLLHYSIKGCCFDFAAELKNARFSVLTGFICAKCLEEIRKTQSDQLAKDAQMLLKKEWLGTVAEPSIAAVTAKKLGYDLFHTKGIVPTRWERIQTTLEEEAVKTILKIISAVAIAGLLLYFGLKK